MLDHDRDASPYLEPATLPMRGLGLELAEAAVVTVAVAEFDPLDLPIYPCHRRVSPFT